MTTTGSPEQSFGPEIPVVPAPSIVPGPPPTPRVSWLKPGHRTESGPVARWVVAGTALVGTAALSGYLFFVDPNNPASLYPKCPLKLMTGIDCPGCGGLRATNALLHGDIMGAIDHNILALVILPLMLYALVRMVAGRFDRTLPPIPSRPFVRWFVPLFVLVFTVVRNIPVGPFAYLGSA